jgi:hypothetical protein
VIVPVRNLSDLELSGKVTLSRKGKKVGSKSYRAAARATRKVALKLSRAAFRALRRKGKLKLGVKVTAKAAQGRTTTKRATFTVKAPLKKKKKRKRRSAGGKLDGDYTGPDGVVFDVTNGGRQIRNLRMPVVTSCFTFPSGIQIKVLIAAVAKITVRSDGTFSGAQEPEEGYKTEYSGTLRNGRVTNGKMRLRVSGCTGARDWSAKRK